MCFLNLLVLANGALDEGDWKYNSEWTLLSLVGRRPPVSAPNVRTMLRAMRVGHNDWMVPFFFFSFFIASSSTNSLLLFLLQYCPEGSSVMRAAAHPLLKPLVLKSGNVQFWEEKNIVRSVTSAELYVSLTNSPEWTWKSGLLSTVCFSGGFFETQL